MNHEPELWRRPVAVEAPLITWVTVHGNLCLALRHPQNRGTSRTYCIEMIRTISRILVESGVCTPAEMAAAEQLERQEGTPL